MEVTEEALAFLQQLMDKQSKNTVVIGYKAKKR